MYHRYIRILQHSPNPRGWNFPRVELEYPQDDCHGEDHEPLPEPTKYKSLLILANIKSYFLIDIQI